MPKTRYFLEKSCKNRRSVGGSAPKPPWPPAAGAPPQTPCCCSHMLLQVSTNAWL